MKLGTTVALRKIKREKKKTALTSVSVLVSAYTSAALFFFILSSKNAASFRSDLPIDEFLDEVFRSLSSASVFILLFSLIGVGLLFFDGHTDRASLLAVLSSVGAGRKDTSRVIFTEISVTCFLPCAVGIPIGAVSGVAVQSSFFGATPRDASEILVYILAVPLSFAALSILYTAAAVLPEIIFKKPIIRSVKRANTKASEVKHGYRQSKTFRALSPIKKLAEKSIEYRKSTYTALSVSLGTFAMYPITGAVTLYKIATSELVLDLNPFDNVDTYAEVISAAGAVFSLFFVCFFALTAIAAVQALLSCRSALSERKKSAHLYSSVGMTEREISALFRRERFAVILRSLLFITAASLAVLCLG